MKILKKIGIVLLILFGIYILISLFLPSSFKVERNITIKAPAKVVFDQINILKNWKSWSYWDNIDPAMKSEYSGPESGAGAIHSWTSDNENVGKGSLKIVESKPDSLVVFELSFGEMGTSIGGYTIKETEGGVVATTYMNIEMVFFCRIFPGLMMESFLGGDFEKTLQGLKKHAESLSKETATTLSEIKVEATTAPSMIYASTRMETNNDKISSDIGASYGKIGAFMTKNGLEQSGAVFAIYHSYSPEKIDLECGIPVNKNIKGEGDVKVSEMKAGNAVVAHYYGPYEGTGAAHESIDKWIKENNKKVTGSPWEVYITDPGIEKDTMKWLTDVYYPIE
jgi:effector-binding domain-containing protein